MKYCVLVVFLFLHSMICIGQNQTSKQSKQRFPTVGKPMPDFVLSDVVNYKTKKISLKDFRGKWLFLDWWSRYCTGCIESFPKCDSLQREFNGRIQYVFVGINGGPDGNNTHVSTDEAVRTIYKKAKTRLDLSLPFAFDSTLSERFQVGKVPYIIIIDPKGIVRGITTSVTAANIRDLLNDKQPALTKAYRRGENPKYDFSLPLLTTGSLSQAGTDTSFLYRSLLMKSPLDGVYSSVWELESGRAEFTGWPLYNLLQMAYFQDISFGSWNPLYGKVYPSIVYESKTNNPHYLDSFLKKSLYGYSLIVPKYKANPNFMISRMQSDLSQYLDIEAQVEIRDMPYWKLVATEKVKTLKTKGIKGWKDHGTGGFAINNMPIGELIARLQGNFQRQVFINETGIDYKIDITIDAKLDDFEDFRRALKENGLELVQGKKQMKVLVIKDAKIN